MELQLRIADPFLLALAAKQRPVHVPELPEWAEHGLCIPVLQCLNHIKWAPPALESVSICSYELLL